MVLRTSANPTFIIHQKDYSIKKPIAGQFLLNFKGEIVNINKSMKEKIRKILEIVKGLFIFIFKFIAILILIAILIYITPKIVDFLRPKAWTLFVYSTDMPDTDYLIQRIDGYQSQTECLEKGLSHFFGA